MAKRPYTKRECQKDLTFIHAVDYSHLLNINAFADGWVESARSLLEQRYPSLRGTPTEVAPDGQIRGALPDIYHAAQRRVQRYQQRNHRDGAWKTYLRRQELQQKDFERKRVRSRLEGRLEVLVGDEAELYGACGCVPVGVDVEYPKKPRA